MTNAVRITATLPCAECDGSGVEPDIGDLLAPCTACDGTGEVVIDVSCATCAHWIKAATACMRPLKIGALFFPGYQSAFYTKANYACVQWEPITRSREPQIPPNTDGNDGTEGAR